MAVDKDAVERHASRDTFAVATVVAADSPMLFRGESFFCSVRGKANGTVSNQRLPMNVPSSDHRLRNFSALMASDK